MSFSATLLDRVLNRCVFTVRLCAFRLNRAWILFARFLRLGLVAAKLPVRKEYLILHTAGYDTGMFSQFATVLGLLEHYENCESNYAGLHVDFADRGLYFDPAIGQNWWTYFYEPIEFGAKCGAAEKAIDDRLHIIFAARTEETMSRKRGAELVRRYVRVRPYIQEKVEAFVDKNFEGAFVIGIHYRGTDKCQETPRVPYERVHAAVLKAIHECPTDRYKVFLATDEQPFLDYMYAHFTDRLVYCEAYRSIDGSPTDIRKGNNYKKGEEAVLDCLLLSRCNYLIRTSSNLSLFSTFFGPQVPEILLDAANDFSPARNGRSFGSICRFWKRASNKCAAVSARWVRSTHLFIVAMLPLRREILVLNGACYAPGMFSQIASVVGLLEHYENWQSSYAGLRVDFQKEGLYYDAAAGDNWWEYFFEPIEIKTGKPGFLGHPSADRQSEFAGTTETKLSRARGAELVERYVRVKPHILDKVESFVRENFSESFVVGIHYRGTDKHEEAPRIHYETVLAKVQEVIGAAGTNRCMVFLATDEQAFLDFILARFTGKICYCEAFRSVDGRPIDVRNDNNYRKGEEAVMDCLVLARCDYLIRTASNLSLFSTLFNPGMPTILVDGR